MPVQRFLLCVSLFILLLSGTLPALGNTSILEEARELFEQGELQTAYDRIYQIPLGDLDPKRMALIQLFRGILSYEMGDHVQALKELDRSIKLGTRLRDVAHFYKGLTHIKMSKTQKAAVEFNSVEDWDASDFLQDQTQYELAQIALGKKDIVEAQRILKHLERKMRGSDNYPGIVYSLLEIAMTQKKQSRVCFWAKKLYKSYPTYDKVMSWGLNLRKNKVGKKALKCADSLADRKARLRRLQWLGASSKALAEIQEFQKGKESDFDKSVIMANYLINEGHVTEALEKLLPYYKGKKKDFRYTMLLAKAAARAGEFQTAIGVYTKAAKTFKGSKSRTALFRAAFLSYQHQDYDGALRRFQELKVKHPKSSLTKQANWYIPWLFYLKGNYERSYDLLTWALDKKSRRLPRRISSQQMDYWRAMCMMKLNKRAEAEQILSSIAQDELIGYYSAAAVQRLKELAGNRPLAFVEQQSSIRVHENWLPYPMAQQRSIASAKPASFLQKTRDAFFAEWQNLPFMQEYLQLGDPAEIYTQVEEPELRYHIERAKDMAIIGMYNLAKWELYSIEKRTKNKEYLKTLMFEYHRNGIYHRSSYLGTRYFANLRTHLGLHLGASLWQFVYPRAFEKYVSTSATRFNVPPEFVWSIMKAETNFRSDAVSPVGAKGLMQVMNGTGRKVASLLGRSNLQPEELLMPHVSVQIGTRYLHRLLKKFQNKIPLAAAAYNGGPHRVHAWLAQFGHLEMDEFIEHIPFLETRNYVKRVVRYYAVYNLLYNKNNEASSWLADLVDVHLDGSPPTKETWEVL